MTKDTTRDQPELSPRRRRLFRAITFSFPWLLLLLLEAGLRVGGYGSSSPLFVRQPGHPEWMAINPEVGRRWFRGGPFVPTPELELFRAEKRPGTLRLFFQGESSAQGFPYGHGAMPSRMLEQRLQAGLPGREVEVVNVAFTAVNSYTLVDQVHEIIAQQPDAVLIYTGHNEYYGAFGAGSPTSRPRTLVRAILLLRHSRLAQLVHAGVTRLAGPREAAGARGAAGTAGDAPRTVMQLMAGEQSVPLDSERYQRGLEQFRRNLRELLLRYRLAGVRVLIGTVASNERDQPPLDGPRGAASDAYARARALEASGDSAAARAAYREAKERDALRFRAPEAINAIIRAEAASQEAIVVETQRALERASPGGIVGASLMLEHLHPNLQGYAIIADAFHDAMRARGMGVPAADRVRTPDALAPAQSGSTITPVDSLVGVFRTDRLTAGWPFQPRGAERTPIVDTLVPRTLPEQLARGVVLGQLPWAEATERLRDAAERAGDHALARRAARALAQEFAWSAAPCVDAARASLALDDTTAALAWARAALAREETAAGREMLGLAELRRGQRDAALLHLRRAVELAPADRRAQAVASAAQALPELERRRAMAPGDAPADSTLLFELALAHAFTRRLDRAREAGVALRRVSPGFSRLRDLDVIGITRPAGPTPLSPPNR